VPPTSRCAAKIARHCLLFRSRCVAVIQQTCAVMSATGQPPAGLRPSPRHRPAWRQDLVFIRRINRHRT
jgi:hypothetical protein